MSARSTIATLAVALASVVFTPGALADQYTSIDDARANGDPSATAPGFGSLPWTALYKGQVISKQTAGSRGLICNFGNAPQITCFDTDAEATQAGAAQASHAVGASSAPGAVAQAGCTSSTASPLIPFYNIALNSSEFHFYTRHCWYDFSYFGSFDDNTESSYVMGAHSGHHAANTYAMGLGNYYPGNTSVGATDSDMRRYPYHGGTWNDQASSLYRN